MKEIHFTGLGLDLEVNSIAIKLGNISIYWYAIFIVIAFSVAILFCKRDDGKYNIKYEQILEVLLFVMPISIICARLYFVIFKLTSNINLNLLSAVLNTLVIIIYIANFIRDYMVKPVED